MEWRQRISAATGSKGFVQPSDALQSRVATGPPATRCAASGPHAGSAGMACRVHDCYSFTLCAFVTSGGEPCSGEVTSRGWPPRATAPALGEFARRLSQTQRAGLVCLGPHRNVQTGSNWRSGKHCMTDLEILSGYIRNETGYEGELSPDLDLLEKQILDSFSIVQWAMFIQERFGIELEAEELVRDNLSSLSNVMALVNSKRSASVGHGQNRP